MKRNYQIGEAARLAGLTIETLRHYDRIGLVKPHVTDRDTGYRYYSDHEVTQLQIVQFLRSIDLSLSEIKKLLYDDDIPSTLNSLRFAEEKIDAEIERLLQVKYHLRSTAINYSTKRLATPAERAIQTPTVKELPAQTIFLARGLEAPTLGDLYRLHDVVEGQIDPAIRDQFQFENATGVLLRGEESTLFANCIRSGPHPNLVVLPAGRYLCSFCPDADYLAAVRQMRQFALDSFGTEGSLVVLDLVFTGIIQWEYQIRLLLDPQPEL